MVQEPLPDESGQDASQNRLGAVSHPGDPEGDIKMANDMKEEVTIIKDEAELELA